MKALMKIIMAPVLIVGAFVFTHSCIHSYINRYGDYRIIPIESSDDYKLAYHQYTHYIYLKKNGQYELMLNKFGKPMRYEDYEFPTDYVEE